ncbi:SETMR methyltransferase, partial [Acromyrmex charruanus]
TVANWFHQFRNGNFDVKDAHRFGRPNKIFYKIEENRHVSSYDIAKELNIDHKTVLGHLRKVGYKEVRCVPCEFVELNKVNLNLKEACDNHLSRFFTEKSWKFYTDGIMTLPEKWLSTKMAYI